MLASGNENERDERQIEKEAVLEKISQGDVSAFDRYASFFVGRKNLSSVLQFEVLTSLLGPMPGAAGLLLRKFFYPRLFRSVGRGVVFGRGIALRHPGNVSIGDRAGIDDDCLIDGSGAGDEGVVIGDDVLIARSTIVQAKLGPIHIGNYVNVGSQCQISSVSGICIGENAMIAGQCYIGGGRYYVEDRNTPIREQGIYSKGMVVVGEDVWIGAGARIMDGVEVGKGSVIGAGAVIQEDVPPYTVVAPYQKLVKLPRGS